MRVALLGFRALAAVRGGVEAHAEAIATRLAARGHDVAAFVRARYVEGGSGVDRGVRLLVRPAPAGKHLEAGVHSLLGAAEAALRRFDVVHFHAVGPALFCALPRLARKRVVTTIHAADYERAKWGPVARRFLRAGERSALRFSHAVLCVSRPLAERLGVEYLPNGVDAPGAAPPREITRRFGLAGDDYLLFLGRHAPEKRVPELIEAFRQADTGLRLVVAGGRGGPPADGCFFPGPVSGTLKEELLANAFAFVTFSELEGEPIACLEAMAYGRACLASDIPAHRELFAHGRGLVRPAESHEERVAALRAIARTPAVERAALGRAARAWVRGRHDWERVVDRLEAVYGGAPAEV